MVVVVAVLLVVVMVAMAVLFGARTTSSRMVVAMFLVAVAMAVAVVVVVCRLPMSMAGRMSDCCGDTALAFMLRVAEHPRQQHDRCPQREEERRGSSPSSRANARHHVASRVPRA